MGLRRAGKDNTYGTDCSKFTVPTTSAGIHTRPKQDEGRNRQQVDRQVVQASAACQPAQLRLFAQPGPPMLPAPEVQPAQRLPAAPAWLPPAASLLPKSFCRIAGTGGRSLPT